jgi:hypothetical protein
MLTKLLEEGERRKNATQRTIRGGQQTASLNYFLSETPQYRRSLSRNTIAVTPFRGVGFGAVWEAPP